MKESRKVILVMSNAFARSEWCQFEVLLAHERFLKNGSDTLVTVLLEDVSSRHFTNALNIILTATTYPIWSEKQEHENLYNVCTTYAHILPLEQVLVFRVPISCPHRNKLRIHHMHNPYY
jgi:hypothetical protein